MKDLWKILFGVLSALLITGIIRLVSDQPHGYPIELIPPPTPGPIVIHVSGAVKDPGVYKIEAGSRIGDAITAAGGFSVNADRESWNLAAFAVDGSQIHVPIRSEPSATEVRSDNEDSSALPTPSPTEITQTSPPRIKFPIDINTASSEELELLPLIGQVRAARIVAYRDTHGYFKRIEDIRNVYDINSEVYAAIKDLITASQPLETSQPLLLSPAP